LTESDIFGFLPPALTDTALGVLGLTEPKNTTELDDSTKTDSEKDTELDPAHTGAKERVKEGEERDSTGDAEEEEAMREPREEKEETQRWDTEEKEPEPKAGEEEETGAGNEAQDGTQPQAPTLGLPQALSQGHALSPSLSPQALSQGHALSPSQSPQALPQGHALSPSLSPLPSPSHSSKPAGQPRWQDVGLTSVQEEALRPWKDSYEQATGENI
jgi:hypothetical protein